MEVTALGFGGATIGGFGKSIPEKTAGNTVREACRASLNLFDTSPYYGYGRSEHRCGHVLRDRPRDSYLLSTKVGRCLEPLRPGESANDLRPGGLQFRPVFDYSYDGAMRSYEQSVARLGVGLIDILLIHDVDAFSHGGEDNARRWFETALDGACRALGELRRCGDVQAIGVGLNDVSWCRRFLEVTDIDCVLLAGRYTLLDQSALPDLLPTCVARNVGMIVGGPCNSGILAAGAVKGARYNYTTPTADVLDRVSRIAAICAMYGVPMQAAALQFPLSHPAVSTVIAGAATPGEVAANVEFMNFPIPSTLWKHLRSEGFIDEGVPGIAGRDQ
ncbi:MAG: aldo/keto reductase [Paracoccaceae bacterium]|nr:aldo/keto reductase [Paracoccaceae bacterium]